LHLRAVGVTLAAYTVTKHGVIPAKAGISVSVRAANGDPRLRGDDPVGGPVRCRRLQI